MNKVLIILPFLLFSLVFAQNPAGFDKMATNMADKRVPIIKSTQVNQLLDKKKEIIFLDAREPKEYAVSHIKGATFVGYDDFNLSSVEKLDKNKIYVVYCSVGYRSGKIGYKLKEAGFTKVYNLYGGLFDWTNNGFPIYKDNKKTNLVHPYNKNWGKWLKEEHRSK